MRGDIDQPRKAGPGDRLDPTRARPEPWFVGNGRGLMIAVLATCAVLIAIRIASLVWLAESAWSWWATPPAATAQRDQSRLPASPPRRMLPAVDPTKADAGPTGNPAAAFGPDAYPRDAIRAGQQGRTVADLTIDEIGTPVHCAIRVSSGSPSLDRATCSIAIRKVRFEPARDARGAVTRGRYRLPVRWVLPDG